MDELLRSSRGATDPSRSSLAPLRQCNLVIHPYNATKALSFLMQFEGFVYVLKAQFMRYELVQTKLLQHKHTSLVAHYIQNHDQHHEKRLLD